MLYCYKPLDIFWSDQGNLEFTAFHVTPYLSQILKKGEILPTIHTGKSTLGENEGLSHSIRGCLVSFFDDFQLAMNGCYSLALYAMLKKNLLSSEQFAKLIKDEWINVHGGEHEFDIENGLNLMTFTQITTALYTNKEINTLFVFLNKCLDFQNPHILTEDWVKELPDTIEGILDSIGVLEVKFSKKYIADLSVYMGTAPSIYTEYVHSKGDFGQSTDEITDKVRDYFGYWSDDEMKEYYGTFSSDIAKTIVQNCDKKEMQFSESLDLVMDELRELSIIDHDTYIEDLEFDEVQGTVNVDNEITFVTEVKIPRNNLAIWNPAENEWRIPAYEGISVNKSNVVALARDIQTAMGGTKLIYQKGTTVRGRKNPYPYYEDCDEAFEELENLFLPILDLQRDIFLKNAKDWLESDFGKDYYKFEIKKLETLIQLCTHSETLEELKSHFEKFKTLNFLFPIYFLTENVKVETNIHFLHVFSSQRFDSIQEEGLYGRATPSKMTLTREIEDFYIKDNGYIFAYSEDDWTENSTVQGSCAIVGIAKKGISFYFTPDKERQLIIPLKCIEEYSVEYDYLYCEYIDDEFLGDNTFDPLKYKFSKK